MVGASRFLRDHLNLLFLLLAWLLFGCIRIFPLSQFDVVLCEGVIFALLKRGSQVFEATRIFGEFFYRADIALVFVDIFSFWGAFGAFLNYYLLLNIHVAFRIVDVKVQRPSPFCMVSILLLNFCCLLYFN